MVECASVDLPEAFMRLLILLVMAISWVMPLCACDVNLFAIIAGTTRQDAFNESITRVARSVKELGDGYSDNDAAEKLLLAFMNSWVDFSSSFSQHPPDWGKDDSEWQAKFSELGRIIGEIRRRLVTDQIGAHEEMLKFSRRLSGLYEYMPMSDRERLLLEFTSCFDHLWEAFFAQNLDGLKSHATAMIGLCSRLENMVSAEDREKPKNISKWSGQIRDLAGQPDVFKNSTLRMTLSLSEAEFINLNKRLSAALKPINPGNANSSDH